MTIRDATVADCFAIAQLTTELGYPAAEDAILARLTRILGRVDQLVLVAIVQGQIAGWLQAHTTEVLESGFRAEITGLVVCKDRRRCGIGRALIQRAEQWALTQGAESVTVRSNTQRIESHSFYSALGFTAVKTQTVYRKLLKS